MVSIKGYQYSNWGKHTEGAYRGPYESRIRKTFQVNSSSTRLYREPALDAHVPNSEEEKEDKAQDSQRPSPPKILQCGPQDNRENYATKA